MELLFDDSNVAQARETTKKKSLSNQGQFAPGTSRGTSDGDPNAPAPSVDSTKSGASNTSTNGGAPSATTPNPSTTTAINNPSPTSTPSTSAASVQTPSPVTVTSPPGTLSNASKTGGSPIVSTKSSVSTQPNNSLTTSGSTSTPSNSSKPAGASISGVSKPSTSPSPVDEDMGYTAGALAGAIVGSIIGASLITLLIAVLFFRKRSKADEGRRRHRSHHGSPRRRRTSDLGAAFMEKKTSTYGSDELQWQAYLPQPADDNTVRQTVKTLFDRVELHVDNYYRRSEVIMNEETAQSLSQLSVGRPQLALDRLMSDPRLASSVIKRCITDTLLVGIRPGRYPEGALLPDYLAAAPLQTQTSSSVYHGEEFATQRAYSMWKRLTAYLHVSTDDDRAALSQKLGTAISGLTRQLAQAFAPWQDLNTDAAKENERELFHLASSVGIMVASQPCIYRFAWGHDPDHPDATSRRHLVVFPSFWKMTDEEGRTLERPQQLLVATVVDP